VFVVPETVRINLSDDEWIEVKKELNVGEERRHFSLASVSTVIDGRVVEHTDWSMYEILRAQLWMTKWHVHDENGEVPPLSLDAIKALTVDVFEEINQAIISHATEQAEIKKARTNPRGTSATPISQ
jgi:hypothetical protein